MYFTMRIFIVTAYLSCFCAVGLAQLPYAIQVEDLNPGIHSPSLAVQVVEKGYYLTAGDGCLYYGSPGSNDGAPYYSSPLSR